MTVCFDSLGNRGGRTMLLALGLHPEAATLFTPQMTKGLVASIDMPQGRTPG